MENEGKLTLCRDARCSHWREKKRRRMKRQKRVFESHKFFEAKEGTRELELSEWILRTHMGLRLLSVGERKG